MTLSGHLVQCTVFAAGVWLASLTLRSHRARVRYWLWLSASVKFLLPFALLVTLGSQVQQRTSSSVPPAQLSIVMAADRPPVNIGPDFGPPRNNWVPVLRWIWISGSVLVLTRWVRRWRRASAILGSGVQAGTASGVPLLVSPAAIEPGVFGIFRPRILLPESVRAGLSAAQLDAVLAHELCHVRYRDNLAAAVHMLVEATFWFHPLVWWIGARLVEEREHACDEEVLRWGSDPEVYAEGILTVCRVCAEAPLPCVSGISGAGLSERIEAIMALRTVRRLDFSRRALLTGVGIAAVAVPLAVGLLRAQERDVPRQAFEIASVKPLPEPKNWPWPEGFSSTPKRSGARLTWITSTRSLLYYAFHVQRWQAVLPAGLHDSFYAIDAQATEIATEPQVRIMFQTLLKDRFKLAAHRETRESNGYILVVNKGGPKIKEFKDTDEPPPMPEYFSTKPRGAFEGRLLITKEGGLHALTGRRVTIAQLAEGLEGELETFVLDKTGLSGSYYFGTKFLSANARQDVDGPSIFAALQEALGLRLEKQKGPLDLLIVDRMETAPTEN